MNKEINMDVFNLEGLQYLIRYPNGFSNEKQYPTILFFHGAGTRGNDIEAVKDNPFFEEMDKRQDFPFVVVAPLCSEDSWFDMWERVKKLVKHVSALEFVDADRVYVMGASMGGYATWQLAMSMPDAFAAIVPICGGGMYWNASRIRHLPIWAFHGAKDNVVSVTESQKMVERINSKPEGYARLTIYPENAHNAWSDTYANDEVYAWLLSHKRVQKGTTARSDLAGSKIYG